MPEQNLTIDDIRKIIGPNAKIDSTMILHYGRTTLHCQLDTVQLDAAAGVFHPVLKVVKEIKPARQARKPKDDPQPQAAKAGGKK